MDQIELNFPTKVRYGVGSLIEINQYIPKALKKLLIVISPSFEKSTYFITLKDILHERNFEFYCKKSGEPDLLEVTDIVKFYKEINAEGLIAIGGGSVIDAAKAAAVAIDRNISIEEALSIKIDFRDVFLMAIPTTAGTGAETSRGAILSNTEAQLKQGLRGFGVAANIAIVDPKLTYSTPKRVAAITGFDIITHAVETFVSKQSNMFTETLSLNALLTVPQSLISLLNNMEDLNARSQLSYQSCMMGINLGLSSTCLPHRLQYPLGIKTHTEHATGLAILYPAWIELTYALNAKKFEEVLTVMNLSLNSNFSNLKDLFLDLLIKIRLNSKLSDFKIDLKDCHEMSLKVEGSLANDPGYQNGMDLSQFYINSI